MRLADLRLVEAKKELGEAPEQRQPLFAGRVVAAASRAAAGLEPRLRRQHRLEAVFFARQVLDPPQHVVALKACVEVLPGAIVLRTYIKKSAHKPG